MDGLLPIRRNARAYESEVTESGERRADYRLYEVQNGNHIETYTAFYSQLELIQPHAQHAFELLVEHVEHDRPLPPSQCIPHRGRISNHPAQRGHCRQLFVPRR